MSNSVTKSKVNTSLLKNFLKEFEAGLDKAELCEKTSEQEYLTELAKCYGLMDALAKEAGYLALDVAQIMKMTSTGLGSLASQLSNATTSKNDILDLFGSLGAVKPTGNKDGDKN
jgi:hypothetical protein